MYKKEIDPSAKWNFMMAYCLKHKLSPSLKENWGKAEEEYNKTYEKNEIDSNILEIIDFVAKYFDEFTLEYENPAWDLSFTYGLETIRINNAPDELFDLAINDTNFLSDISKSSILSFLDLLK